jgi:hypothetical protein
MLIRTFDPTRKRTACLALMSMSVPKLQTLRTQVEAAITATVTNRHGELEGDLANLGEYDGRGEMIRGAGTAQRTKQRLAERGPASLEKASFVGVVAGKCPCGEGGRVPRS